MVVTICIIIYVISFFCHLVICLIINMNSSQTIIIVKKNNKQKNSQKNLYNCKLLFYITHTHPLQFISC